MDSKLIEQNPWWHERKAIEADKHINDYRNAKVRLPLPEMELKNGISIIRGPRQVGKTTFLKHRIMDFIASTDPRQAFFFNLESGVELDSALRQYLDFSDSGNRRLIIIDEATEDKGWATKVKYLFDSGKITRKDSVIVSGSSSIDLKERADRLPGRAVEGNEYLFYPYSFRDFFPPGSERCGLQDFDEKEADEIHLDEETRTLFSKYIMNGGLPAVWNTDPELARERYARWIEGLVAKNNKSIIYARELLERLTQKTTFDFLGLARETSISSHHTVESFISFFEAGMIGKLVYNYNLATGAPDPKKEKKFVFLDPFLSGIFSSRREESFIVEDIVGSHLLRVSDEMYFQRDNKGEVDFLCRIGSDLIPVEVKWQEEVDERDTRNLKKFGAGFIVTKNTFARFGKILAVPAPVFLRMIGQTLVKRRLLK